jgi:hypothetical protein
MITKRKKRSDRNHIIYSLTVKGQEYIGVTHVENGKVNKSLDRRWRKHVGRAMTECKMWKLCVANFTVGVLEIVRGKSAAHIRERELIRERKPKLNSDIR